MNNPSQPRQPRITSARPIIYPLLKWLYPEFDFKRHSITWGDTIYSLAMMAPDILAHETTHCRQQRWSKVYGFFAIMWYYFSKDYRYACELEAMKNQARWYAHNIRDRNQLHAKFVWLANELSSGLYGRMVSFDEAFEAVTDII